MTKIFECETGLNANAIGDRDLLSTKAYHLIGLPYGESYGLSQVRYLPGRPDPSELLSVTGNLKEAKRIYQAQGYAAWFNCSTKLGIINQ